MPPFIISQKSLMDLSANTCSLDNSRTLRWQWSIFKPGLERLLRILVDPLFCTSEKPEFENTTLTFLLSRITSDCAAAAPISDSHCYAIRLFYGTLGRGHRESNFLIGFGYILSSHT